MNIVKRIWRRITEGWRAHRRSIGVGILWIFTGHGGQILDWIGRAVDWANRPEVLRGLIQLIGTTLGQVWLLLQSPVISDVLTGGGVLLIVWALVRPEAPPEQVSGTSVASVASATTGKSIHPPGASGPSEAQASDTLAHVTIDPTDPPSHPPGIWLYDWYPRKPMGYMVFIRNSRPHPAQIIGYEIKVKSEDLAFVQQVSWPTIDGIASNGFPALLSHLDGWPDRPPLGSRPRAIGPIPLPADQRISLIIPVDISDIARAHTDNPRWSAEGWFHLRCGASEEIVDFHDPLGRYQLSEEDWAKARTAFAPR